MDFRPYREKKKMIEKLRVIAEKANSNFKGTLRVADYYETYRGTFGQPISMPAGYSILEVARPFSRIRVVLPFTSREILRLESTKITIFDPRAEEITKEVMGDLLKDEQ